jgi:cytochrome c biogenesis protein CcdA
MNEINEPMNSGYQAIPPMTGRKVVLPHSITALILGIVSLANMALFGWIPAIISMNYAKKALQLAEDEPGKYTDTSIRMAQAGQKMANIGLVLGILGMFVTGLYYYWIFTQAFHHHSYSPYYY